jgi:hypothetical protein
MAGFKAIRLLTQVNSPGVLSWMPTTCSALKASRSDGLHAERRGDGGAFRRQLLKFFHLKISGTY